MGEIIETGYRNTNLLNYTTWVTGTTGSQTGFNCYGSTSENHLITAVDSMGKAVPIWESRTDAVSGPDGGWYTPPPYITIDNTKMYRFTTWIKRDQSGSTTGHFYLGLNGFNSSDVNVGVYHRSTGVNNTNPYFEYNTYWQDWGNLNQWYLVVGHIWPVGSGTGSKYIDSGIYDTSGNLIHAIMDDFVWRTDNTQANHRSYHYYSTLADVRQQWVYPRVDIIDGTEPSLDDLIAGYDSYTFDLQNSLDGGAVTKPLKISNEKIEVNLISEIGITDGIVGYWPLDNDTNDLSGNNVIETSTNITYTTGIKSSAGNFNGTTSQITFDSEIFRNDSFTMSIWINAINVGSGQNFSGILSITSGVRLLIDSNGDLVFKTYNGSTDDLMEYNTNLYDSNWHQVVATYSYNDKKLYLNSNLVDSGSYINNWNYSDNATIGYNIDSIISHFYGYLDEVKIYKRALSIEEINIEYEMIKEKKLKMTNSTIFTNGIIEG